MSLIDKTQYHRRSGIYKIKCSECGDKYIGAWGEHLTCATSNKISDSIAYARKNHMNWVINNVILKKQVNAAYKLDAYESILMYLKRSISMNTMEAPNRSPLLKSIEGFYK